MDDRATFESFSLPCNFQAISLIPPRSQETSKRVTGRPSAHSISYVYRISITSFVNHPLWQRTRNRETRFPRKKKSQMIGSHDLVRSRITYNIPFTRLVLPRFPSYRLIIISYTPIINRTAVENLLPRSPKLFRNLRHPIHGDSTLSSE